MTGSGLVAAFGTRRPEGFTLELELGIEPGTTAALLGPNGAGKSTAVDVIGGLLPIATGRIELDGLVLADAATGVHLPPEDRRVGIVFQQYLLFEHMSVRDNVAFGPASAGRTRREARDAAQPWIELFDLVEHADRRPSQLSGGEAQRVAMARALAADPAILLLDEPMAALDVSARTQLRRTLAEHLADYDGPRLLITHDPADAFLLADRIHILERGRITQVGSAEQLRRRPATEYAAALAGLNLFTGTNSAGTLALDRHDHVLTSADTHTTGPVVITIHPNAIALHAEEPHGSPRNSWPTTIGAMEALGDITRVTVDRPLPLSVDITPAAAVALSLRPGSQVWVSIKATEIDVSPT